MGFTNTAIGLRSGAAERRGCLLSYAGYEVPGGAACYDHINKHADILVIDN